MSQSGTKAAHTVPMRGPFDANPADVRFFALVGVNFVVVVLITLLIHLIDVPEEDFGGGDDISDRYAELLIAKALEDEGEDEVDVPAEPEPEPEEEPEEPEPEPEVEPEPEPDPQPTPPVEQPEPVEQPAPAAPTAQQQQEAARRVAEESGIADIRNAFAGLGGDQASNDLPSNDNLITARGAGGAARPVGGGSGGGNVGGSLTEGAAAGSQGIDTSGLSRRAGSTELSGRNQSTSVSSPTEQRAAAARAARGDNSQANTAGSSRGNTRSAQNVQRAFDRAKNGFATIHRRAARSDPTLDGLVVIVLQIVIQPSGKVSDVSVISSDTDNQSLVDQIVRRVRVMDFGAQPVPPLTVDYSLNLTSLQG